MPRAYITIDYEYEFEDELESTLDKLEEMGLYPDVTDIKDIDEDIELDEEVEEAIEEAETY